MSESPPSESPLPLKQPYVAAFLAWLIPGLGHYYQGRTGKAILYAACILSLFYWGLYLGAGQVVYWRWSSPFQDPEQFRWSYLCQFFTGIPALPALLQGTLEYRGSPPILWGFMTFPTKEMINSSHLKLGNLVEIGTIYTMVAGLLNVLAIYDAFAGPAYLIVPANELEHNDPTPASSSSRSTAGDAKTPGNPAGS